ncbi:MAG: hypothetical protein U9R19_16610 [Bacteroidota bacterium]|nr:hypothetical protein [Bacteroidota bacterium]
MMKRLFFLFWVHRGFIQEPEIFYNKKDAELRKEEIEEKGFNNDYDEIEIFEKDI